MHKTTIYLPDNLKHGLERAALAEGCSEAELIRRAIGDYLELFQGAKPRIPLFSSGDPTLARRVADNPDEMLTGFGES